MDVGLADAVLSRAVSAYHPHRYSATATDVVEDDFRPVGRVVGPEVCLSVVLDERQPCQLCAVGPDRENVTDRRLVIGWRVVAGPARPVGSHSHDRLGRAAIPSGLAASAAGQPRAHDRHTATLVAGGGRERRPTDRHRNQRADARRHEQFAQHENPLGSSMLPNSLAQPSTLLPPQEPVKLVAPTNPRSLTAPRLSRMGTRLAGAASPNTGRDAASSGGIRNLSPQGGTAWSVEFKSAWGSAGARSFLNPKNSARLALSHPLLTESRSSLTSRRP
jgi:hypothetical protein